jgi:hypothetical protein
MLLQHSVAPWIAAVLLRVHVWRRSGFTDAGAGDDGDSARPTRDGRRPGRPVVRTVTGRRRIDPFCWCAVVPLLAVAVVMVTTGNPWWTTSWFVVLATAVLVFDVWCNSGAAGPPDGRAGSDPDPMATQVIPVATAETRSTRTGIAQTSVTRTRIAPIRTARPGSTLSGRAVDHLPGRRSPVAPRRAQAREVAPPRRGPRGGG